MLLKFLLTYKNNDADQSSSSLFNLNTDSIYICGSAKALGEWNLTDAIEMKLKANQLIVTQNGGSISSQSSQSSCYSEAYNDEW